MKNVKIYIVVTLLLCCTISFKVSAQNNSNPTNQLTAEQRSKSDADQEAKAAEWTASLNLNDAAKETKLKAAIAGHLKTIRDWHNVLIQKFRQE